MYYIAFFVLYCRFIASVIYLGNFKFAQVDIRQINFICNINQFFFRIFLFIDIRRSFAMYHLFNKEGLRLCILPLNPSWKYCIKNNIFFWSLFAQVEFGERLCGIRENFILERYTANWYQGYNARKVISEVYASFVLQCTVSGR